MKKLYFTDEELDALIIMTEHVTDYNLETEWFEDDFVSFAQNLLYEKLYKVYENEDDKTADGALKLIEQIIQERKKEK